MSSFSSMTEIKHECAVVGVPKTIDNDINLLDHLKRDRNQVDLGKSRPIPAQKWPVRTGPLASTPRCASYFPMLKLKTEVRSLEGDRGGVCGSHVQCQLHRPGEAHGKET